jgi:hypothetical protein
MLSRELELQRQFVYDEEAELVEKMIAMCRHAMEHNGNLVVCQHAAQADCLARNQWHRNFTSFSDVDEFYHGVPSMTRALASILKTSSKLHRIIVPSTVFGSSNINNLPHSALVVESFTRRAPFKDLGDDDEAIRSSIANCSAKVPSNPRLGMCDVTHGKSIHLNNHELFGRDAKLGASGRYGSGDMVSGNALRHGTVKMLHYQHRGLEDLLRRGKLWGKTTMYEQAVYAHDFWNAVEDHTLSGNVSLIHQLRSNLVARMQLISSNKTRSMKDT